MTTLSEKKHKWGIDYRYEEKDVKEAIKELKKKIKNGCIKGHDKWIQDTINEIFGKELCK